MSHDYMKEAVDFMSGIKGVVCPQDFATFLRSRDAKATASTALEEAAMKLLARWSTLPFHRASESEESAIVLHPVLWREFNYGEVDGLRAALAASRGDGK